MAASLPSSSPNDRQRITADKLIRLIVVSAVLFFGWLQYYSLAYISSPSKFESGAKFSQTFNYDKNSHDVKRGEEEKPCDPVGPDDLTPCLFKVKRPQRRRKAKTEPASQKEAAKIKDPNHVDTLSDQQKVKPSRTSSTTTKLPDQKEHKADSTHLTERMSVITSHKVNRTREAGSGTGTNKAEALPQSTISNEVHQRTRILEETERSYKGYKSIKVGESTVDITQNRPQIQDYTKPPEKGPPVEAPPPTKKPLNTVLLYADDWTLKVMGMFNKHVKTPNIDALAKDGMSFSHNCVTTSVCWISRGTLATGTFAAIHNHLYPPDRNLFTNPHFDWKDTLYPLLKKKMFSGLVGKWHAPMEDEFLKITFDHYRPYFGSHYFERFGKMRHVTELNGADSLDFLRNRPKDKLFHLTVAFFATHTWDGNKRPYHPMNSTMNLYADDVIPEPKTKTEAHFQALPWFFNKKLNEGHFRYTNRFDTPENYQRNMKDLFRMATEVDTVVGDIVAELKSQGVYNDTLIIFTTDNGNMQGEHGLAEKWFAFEESIRVPLVIRDPRMPMSERGKMNDEFTLSVDLAPTILRAADIPVPSFMQGRDMAEIYLQPKQAKETWRKDFFYEWTTGEPVNATGHEYDHIPAVFALIRKDWKYFYYPQLNFEQLFRIDRDPMEESDVVNATETSTKEALELMRVRYAYLKNYSQTGHPV